MDGDGDECRWGWLGIGTNLMGMDGDGDKYLSPCSSLFGVCAGIDQVSDVVSSSLLLQARRASTLQVSSINPVNSVN